VLSALVVTVVAWLKRLKLKWAPSKGEMNMADDAYNVVVAGYLKTAAATVDFGRLVKLVKDKGIKTTEGVILVEHDTDGQVHVTDRAAPGGLIGGFTKHRIESGLETKVGQTIPVGWAGIITLVTAADTATVKGALLGAAKTTSVPVGGHGPNDLKKGLAEAAQSAKRGS
jgi:hypothetical protein